MDAETRSRIADQAKMLAIGHVVSGVMIGGFGLLFVAYIPIGLAILAGLIPMSGTGPPEMETFAGVMFLLGGLFALGFCGGLAAVSFYAARCFLRMRHRTFLVVAQCLNLLHQPIGTVLGVLGLVWLLRAEVAQLFEENRAAA